MAPVLSKERAFLLTWVMARHVLLLRHGELGPAHAGRFWGRTDVPLCDTGRQQAQRLAAMLRSYKIDRCLCSPLLRTRQTAELALAGAGIDSHLDPDFREIDFGDWEGKTFAEIEHACPDAVKQWADFADDFAFPGGESLAGFLRRIRSIADRIAADPAETLLAVTHGGVIRALICHYLGLSPRQYVLFDVRCATLTRIDLFDGRGVLVGLNLSPEAR